MSFPKRINHQYKNRYGDANANFGDFVLGNIYIYTYIHICEKLFTKNTYLNLALTFQAHFPEWSLTHFGKELFVYTVALNLTSR